MKKMFWWILLAFLAVSSNLVYGPYEASKSFDQIHFKLFLPGIGIWIVSNSILQLLFIYFWNDFVKYY